MICELSMRSGSLNFQPFDPCLRGMLISAKPIDALTAQCLMALRQQLQVILGIVCESQAQFTFEIFGEGGLLTDEGP